MLTCLFFASAALYLLVAAHRVRSARGSGEANLFAGFTAVLSTAALARGAEPLARSPSVEGSAERVELVALAAACGLLVHIAVRRRARGGEGGRGHANRDTAIISAAYGAALACALAAAADETAGVSPLTLLSLAAAPLTAFLLLRRPAGAAASASLAISSTPATLAFPLAFLLHDAASAAGHSPFPRLGAAAFVPLVASGAGLLAAPFQSLVLSGIRSSRAAFVSQGEQLDATLRELGRVNAALREAQQELARKEQLAAVGELAAVIAHEVRNPLAIIANAVAGLRRASLSRADRETLHGILDEETSRLNRLVSDLLRYARPLAVQREHVAVKTLIERAMTLARGRPQLRLEMQSEVEGEARLWGDANLLRQVFDNLIENAVQAMQATGLLTVRVRRMELGGRNGLAIDVIDTGEGMDTMVRARAKDPFFTTRPSGTGLGLAIVDRIVEAHGGKFSIQSRSGEGTTATVFLPGESASAVTPTYRLANTLTANTLPASPLPVPRERASSARMLPYVAPNATSNGTPNTTTSASATSQAASAPRGEGTQQ